MRVHVRSNVLVDTTDLCARLYLFAANINALYCNVIPKLTRRLIDA